ncbi:MAG: SusC/RagA family TonB-linked outer membrane protein [Cyclobacteriaceae bacterium]
MQKITALILALALSIFAYAQETITVTGIVTNETGGPAAGVNITAQGSGTSAVTADDGSFSIALKTGFEVLLLKGQGIVTRKYYLSGSKEIKISVKKLKDKSSDQDGLSIGYGSQSKESNTSSISSIDGESISPAPLINLEQSNQGMTTGMFVQNSSGKLGGATTVRVRGGSTLSNSNQPLYVVDGVPLVSQNQSNINPSNIASIEILKDASAAAIYGSRAANGVVIITTKSGSTNKMSIDVDYQFSVQETPKKLDLYSPKEYNIQFIEQTLRTLGNLYEPIITRENLETIYNSLETGNLEVDFFDLFGDPTYQNFTFPNAYGNLDKNTDWQDEIFQRGASHRINLGVQGGVEKLNYFASASYNSQEGILIGNKFERFNGTISLNSQLTDKFKVNLDLNYIYSKDYRLLDDQDLGSPLQAIVLPPSDGYDPADNYNLIVRSLEYNPLTEVNFSDNLGFNNSVIGNLGLTYDITDKLKFDVSGGIDFSELRDEIRQGPETRSGGTTGRSQLGTTDLRNYIFNTYFTFTPEERTSRFTRPTNELSFVVGASYQKSTVESTYRLANINSISELEGLGNDAPELLDVNIPNSVNVFASTFARINYNIKSKYLFQLSARMDGSSKFGADNRFGYFPAISAGWMINEEDFMSSLNFISLLKLKGSYGLIGNTPTDDFLYRRNYFQLNYRNDPGIRLLNLENPELKWETTAQLDLGLEFGIGERISGSIEYYRKNTTDLLFPVPVSQTSGFSSVLRNIGEMENVGVEFNISSTNIQKGDFTWSTDFNISTNDSKITNLNNQQLIVGVNAFLEGQAPGVFYMRKFVRVEPNTGVPLWDNGAGGTTSDYESAPRQVVGNPNPKYFGGLINNLTYKNFNLSFMLQYVGGQDIYWATGEFLANSGILNLNQLATQANRWYEPGDVAEYPVLDPAQENTFPSTRWLQDGSYIRLKSLTVSYDIPAAAGWGLTYMNVYIGGSNLLTFTDYLGYDPDVNYIDPLDGVVGQNISRGIDNFTSPQPRIFMAGIKIGL